MNIVVLKGNLTKDPVSRTVKIDDGKTVTVCNFTLAVNRRQKDKNQEVAFINCEAWDKGAELIVQYLKKGDPLLINGSLKMDQWEVEGEKRSALKVRVNEFEMLGGKKSVSPTAPVEVSENPSVPMDNSDNPDIPF